MAQFAAQWLMRKRRSDPIQQTIKEIVTGNRIENRERVFVSRIRAGGFRLYWGKAGTLVGGGLVELFRKMKSKYCWYDFTVRGERYRGSTKETNETRAQKAAALKLAATIKGSDPLDMKPPTLRDYSKEFLQ